LGRILGIHPYWTGGQWGITDLAVGSTVGEFCIVHDVFSSVVCLMGELGMASDMRALGSVWSSYLTRGVPLQLSWLPAAQVTAKGYENQ